MIVMMKYWVKEIGIDGFKCSMAELVPTDFWEVARKEIDQIKPIIMISEGAIPEYHITAFDLTYSWNTYNLISNIINNKAFVSAIYDSLIAELSSFPKESLHLRFGTTHDKNEEAHPAIEKYISQSMKAAAVLTFMIQGVPYIYNGDEAGSSTCMNLFDKVEIDWSDGQNFRELYELLGTFRRDHPALRQGSFIPIHNTESAKVCSFLRSSEMDSVITVINFAKERKEVNLQMPINKSNEWKDLLSGANFKAKDSSLNVLLLPMGCLVLVPAHESLIQ
jgi:glycosidase